MTTQHSAGDGTKSISRDTRTVGEAAPDDAKPDQTPAAPPDADRTGEDASRQDGLDQVEAAKDGTGPTPAGPAKGGDDKAAREQNSAGEDLTDGASKEGNGKEGNGEEGNGEDGASKDGNATDGTAGSGGRKPDRWAAFGPAPESVPTWYGRLGRRVGRLLIHEWTLAAFGSLALAVLMTWPTLRYPAHTLPQDYWDPSLQAWQMAWSGHALLTDPAQLWHANSFFPERWSFAFSDTLLGYAPAGMIGVGPEAALLRYNIIFVLAHALAAFGAYVLARQFGASRIGSAVAGVTYAYAPWLLAQAGHLHVISNGGIPLALAMLARGHGWSLRHGYRPERRHEGWVYAGWLVAAWQLSLGFGIGLPFAYVLAGIVLVAAVIWFAKRIFWRVRRPFGQRLFVADLIGGLIFAGVGVLLAIPYFTVTQLHPYAERTIADIAVFSPPPSGFVTAPAESRVWGGLHEGARSILPWHPEMTLLPGFALYALAAGGLLLSIWTVRQRLLLLAGVLVTMTLSMGTEFFDGRFTYVPLFEHLPGWSGIRTPGRLMLWATLLLGLLAAGAVSAFAERVREISAERIPSWPSPWLRLATLIPLVLVIAEGTNRTPQPVVPPQPAAMRSVEGPLLVLPSGQNHDQPVMLWSTTRFQDIVNGGSGFVPRQLDDVRRVAMTFPDQTSVDYLRTLGVRNVLVMRDRIAGTPWEVSVDAPVDGLGITREEIDSVVVFRL
ncbi:hypothetical protein SAMN05443287_107129 [Micromonospora phaseoli]|uniref:4-amino-4-deoxy-L-arabinose transferase n=1 Tax=Micromonospora phaseoli TaxID=1144548 RepID=A0A1H7BDZ1_9ACTN|nr:hypothetical protein [Micromonospora phaseoli]PZV95093.1 hypothetical protein CLV64_108233 [Micromonospora phaseoli]GIJ81056.1 hypothetical protein Xph01_54880 [Micromonospora phaseoli]SEJ74507.1 hypothetical protein SAMN05443287_107129 [Micromonospora phaseoli]